MSVYLDWAATALPDPAAIRVFADASVESFANAASPHALGKRSATALESARERCAAALGVSARQLVFTSGGTEGNHIPMLSLLMRPVRGSIAISAIEHPAVMEQARAMEQLGYKMLKIPSNDEGVITPEAVASTVREDTLFVAVMAVNNETGAIQPVREIAASLSSSRRGGRKPHFHVDAVQAVGKIRFSFNAPGIDSVAISAHKIGGPRGIGIMCALRPFEPFLRGGGQEGGFRSGTVNVAGALAFAHCLERCLSPSGDIDEIARIEIVGAELVRILSSIPRVSVIPRARNPESRGYSPAIVQCSNESLPGEVLVRILSERGFFLSTGSACSSKTGRKAVLEAMRLDADTAQRAFRVSIGPTTTIGDIEEFAEELATAVAGTR